MPTVHFMLAFYLIICIMPAMQVDPETGLTPLAKEICIQSTITPGNLTQAAHKAREAVLGEPYKNNKAAGATASRTLSRVSSKLYLATLAAEAKVTPSRIFQKLDKALDATDFMILPSGDLARDNDKQPIKQDNWQVQLRAVDLTCKILGLYQAPAGSDSDKAGSAIDITPEAAEALMLVDVTDSKQGK